jgi:hypothetical protein
VAKRAQQDRDALPVERPETFLRRERAVQTVGVGVLTLFVMAGLAGAFGTGPLADATVTSGAITIRFERFVRQTYRTRAEISVTNANTQAVRIELSRTFLDGVDVLEVRPSDSFKLLRENVAVFDVPAVDGAATLVLEYEPKTFGILETDIVVAGQPAARIRQIVFF